MPFKETSIPGLMIFEPKVFKDSRGYFYESFNSRTFEEAGINCNFVQDNQSESEYGVVRGLHYQLAPFAQAKLVRVLSGEVLDIVVDMRQGSPTFGHHFGIILSADNHRQLYIPEGFAHGFSVLSERATFFYKCSNYYSKEHERGIAYNDVSLNLNWQIPIGKMIVSTKDEQLPPFEDAEYNFYYDKKLQPSG